MADLKLVTISSVKFAVLQSFSVDGVDYNLVWSPMTRELTVEADVDCEDDPEADEADNPDYNDSDQIHSPGGL